MPIISMQDLRKESKSRKNKKQELQERLQKMITKDIATELAEYYTHIQGIQKLIDTGYVVNSDIRLNTVVLPVLMDSYMNLKDAFDKSSGRYDESSTREFRKMLVTSIAQKKYPDLVDRINKL